jgi:hypothetical protein
MVGRQATKRELFVIIGLDEYVSEDHLLRAVDRYLDLSEFRPCPADSYSHTVETVDRSRTDCPYADHCYC